MNRLQKISLLITLVSSTAACRKFVEIPPPKTELITATVFTGDATVTAAVTGMYTELLETGFAAGHSSSINGLCGASADELLTYSWPMEPFENNALVPNEETELKGSIWQHPYKLIYYANSIISGLPNGTGISDSVRTMAEGEAKFIRAFCYFYLANLFGDVPLALTTDYETNNTLTRSPKETVYDQVVTDLKSARELLDDDFAFAGGERIRASKWVATALLARVYLYRKEWALAEAEATTLINNTGMFHLEPLNEAFLKASEETIWSLKPVSEGRNTYEGSLYILDGTPGFVSLRPSIMNEFETGDERKTAWTGVTAPQLGQIYYFPYKYKQDEWLTISSEYSVIFRLGEQYLIRAEARIQQNHIDDGIDDLNVIRDRAHLTLLTGTFTQAAAMQKVEHERRIEFLAEWGHRWLDLKRWPSLTDPSKSRADDILAPLKGSNWQPTDVLYPLPQTEISRNSKLTQNPGYF